MTGTAFGLVIERIEAKTGSAGRNGAWRCPAHDDSNPSLSVSNGGGKVILHCHAGCTPEAIVAAVDLTFADLFDAPPNGSNGSKGGRGAPIATYNYTDEAGVLLFQALRYAPKAFRQRRPDGNGGWTWKLDGTRRVLYRLPEVCAAVASGATIYVCEGEKDADAVTRAGEVGTCNPMGAGKWRPEHAELLAGAAHVVVIADRDEPGYHHAATVAASLQGKTGLVEVVEPVEGKDATDHLAAGHTLAELRPVDLQHAAAAGGEDEAPDRDLAGWAAEIDWAAFWNSDTPEQDWVLEPIVPAGRQVAIYSRAKVGKSLLGLDGAAALATGRPTFGVRSRPARHVVYIDLEMTDDDVRERLEDLGYGPDTDLSHLHYFLLPSLPGLDTDLGGQVVEAIALRCNATMVVIDTMARAVDGDENLADTYRDFFRHTGRRLKAAHIALLRLDHGGKDAALGQRGSSAKADDVDVVFQLTAGDNGLTLKRTHSRIPWVPAEIQLQRHTEPLRHVLTTGLWPDGTKPVAAELDKLNVPLDARYIDADRALKQAGAGRRKQVVLAGLKWRKERP